MKDPLLQLSPVRKDALGILARTAQWRREGVSQHEILQRGADELGLPLTEIEAAYREAAERTA